MAAASSAALTLPPLGSINMDDLLRNMYPSPSPASSSAADHEITLEDFLAKDAASSVLASADPAAMIEDDGGDAGGGGRRRKRPFADPVDKVALQRQKRMIKNRESAARSRERKQAYTMELEALASKLEDENTELVKYQEDQDRTRLKQLMEKVIPITEKKKPRLLRTRSF